MKSPIHILFVHHEKAIGGAPLSLLYLIRGMDRKLYQPRVICLREGPAADLFRTDDIPVEIIPGPDFSHTELVWYHWWQFPSMIWRLIRSLILFFQLRKAFSAASEEGETIIHLNSSTLITAALAAKSLHLPLVWHIREPLTPGYFGFRRAFLRKQIRKLPDQIIAICKNDANQLGSVPAGKLSVIYNFIDFNHFNAAIPKGTTRRELHIPIDSPIILFLGGSAVVKGAYILLEAAHRFLKQLPTARLLIAGETNAEFQAELMHPSLAEVRDRILILETRHDIPQLLANSSLLLFPSVAPHFARPIIEAGAMAKPVIASDIDGVRELVLNHETGILVPPRDPALLARAIVELLRDEPRLIRLGQQALIHARERYDASRNTAATFSVYQRILEECRA